MIPNKFSSAFAGHYLVTSGLLVCLTSLCLPVTFGAQTYKLNSSDGDYADHFGSSVAVSGNKALVGAPGDDNPAYNAGSAYVFDVNTGQELLKLIPSDSSNESFVGFGNSAAMDGNHALIGAFQSDENGSLTGTAHLFDVTTGQQLVKLAASDSEEGDNFGASVALSGGLALVGADRDDMSGSAYLFNATTGGQLAKLTAPDIDIDDRFGVSVSLDGNFAVIGALGADNANGSSTGAAYVFDVSNPLSPMLLHKLTASDGAISDGFGNSVSLSGNLALVSSHAGDLSGSAYLFDVTTGQELAKITPDDAAADQWFGYSVSLSGDKALIGAHSDSEMGSNAGAAYVFDVSDPLAPVQLEKLTASDPGLFRIFGIQVALSGNTALVGTYNGSDTAGIETGAAYLFQVPEPHSLILTALAGIAGVFRRKDLAKPY